jgi:hypothetical protein
VREIAQARGIAHACTGSGRLSEQELAVCLQRGRARVSLSATCPAIVEGFGMVAIESAPHGLPDCRLSMSAASPMPWWLACNGRLIPPTDHAAFAACVLSEVLAQDKGRALPWRAHGVRARVLVGSASAAKVIEKHWSLRRDRRPRRRRGHADPGSAIARH